MKWNKTRGMETHQEAILVNVVGEYGDLNQQTARKAYYFIQGNLTELSDLLDLVTHLTYIYCAYQVSDSPLGTRNYTIKKKDNAPDLLGLYFSGKEE